LGFVKFLKGYYLIMITQKKKIAKIGDHKIYQIKDIEMIQLFKWVSSMRKKDEEKYIDLFKQIKIFEGFYFSYTYDLTHTLQNNVCK
jgi:phosphatidylinositol 3,5-bisphosphate 5-phosphatase